MESVMQTVMKRVDKLDKLDKQQELKRQDEHLETLKWINYQKSGNFPFMIIKGQDYDDWLQSDDEDYKMDMQIVKCNEFYDKFKEISGVHLLNLDHFVKMTYIDEGHNDIEVVVKVDNKQERFVIGV